ncbi:MAG: Rid family hydrolase [Alphaproteobacteria bacterium]|jgi:enamine deaminase RidA (YjgF/YER057c/UK114 family)|nr:Rid family hydrolase [Alphaproteobacteria bacterium]
MQRRDIFDGTEATAAYARAVQVGPDIHVAGTTSADASGEAVGDDLYAQTKETYAKIQRVLEMADAGMRDVVRVVAYVTDITEPDGFNQATIEAFDDTGFRPAATLVEVSALFKPEMLVEIEAYAVVSDN